VKPSHDVLLVEDDRVVREAACRILRPEALGVDCVEDVSEAVARLRAADYRVVLSDLMLPGFSGFDLLDRVTSDRPHVPVVLITGYATIENALHAFERGAFDFLPKPFDVAELLGVVRRALRCAEQRWWSSLAPSRPVLSAEAAMRADLRFLGQHAWAELGADRVTFGVAETFPGLLGEIRGLRLPDPGEMVTQGLAFAEISTADEAVHRVWAPLTGTVVENNSELRADPGLLNRAPFTSGWLTRIVPSALEEQLGALTLRAGSSARTARSHEGKEKRWSSSSPSSPSPPSSSSTWRSG
jgi:DNA-binding response OmpR family regulator